MQSSHGYYIEGICKGYVTKPWKNDHNKVNHILGIAFQFEDNFGDMKENTIQLALDGRDNESLTRLAKQANAYKGKNVRVKCFPHAKGGNSGPWLSVFVPSDSVIECLDK